MDYASGDDLPGTIYEPLIPAFHTITPTHKGPIIIVTSVPLLIVATLTVAVRLWTVYSVTRTLGPSEATIIASIVLAIGYTICINRSAHAGLGSIGDELTDSQFDRLSQQYYASNLLLILALTCAKCSVTFFFIKIIGWKSIWKTGRYLSQAVLYYTILWGIASIFAVAFQCSSNRWALGPGEGATCIDQHAIQIGIRVTDIFSDLVITMLPVLLIRILQTNRKSRFIVVVLFGMRITTIIPTIVSTIALSSFYSEPTPSRPLHAVTPSVWTSVWLFLSIVTACIPSIKQFLTDWAAGLAGAAINDGLNEDQLTHHHGSSGKYALGTSGGSRQVGQKSGTSLAQHLGLARSGRATVTSKSGSNEHNDRGRARGLSGALERGKGGMSGSRRAHDSSESVRHLTEGMILRTTDYAVEYEAHEMVSMQGQDDGSTVTMGGADVRERSVGLRTRS